MLEKKRKWWIVKLLVVASGTSASLILMYLGFVVYTFDYKLGPAYGLAGLLLFGFFTVDFVVQDMIFRVLDDE